MNLGDAADISPCSHEEADTRIFTLYIGVTVELDLRMFLCSRKDLKKRWIMKICD